MSLPPAVAAHFENSRSVLGHGRFPKLVTDCFGCYRNCSQDLASRVTPYNPEIDRRLYHHKMHSLPG